MGVYVGQLLLREKLCGTSFPLYPQKHGNVIVRVKVEPTVCYQVSFSKKKILLDSVCAWDTFVARFLTKL